MTVRKLFRVQIEHEVPIGTYAGKERITSSFYDIMARAETPVEAMRVARDCHQEEAGADVRRIVRFKVFKLTEPDGSGLVYEAVQTPAVFKPMLKSGAKIPEGKRGLPAVRAR